MASSTSASLINIVVRSRFLILSNKIKNFYEDDIKHDGIDRNVPDCISLKRLTCTSLQQLCCVRVVFVVVLHLLSDPDA